MAETQVPTQLSSSTRVPCLRRALTLWDLVFYGIVLLMPIALIPLFGIAQKLSRGHFVTAVLIARVAMMLTAVSHGRMAAGYPAGGSPFTYVGRGVNPHLGFLTGSARCLGNLIQPLFNGILGCSRFSASSL
jgi:putrescine importer